MSRVQVVELVGGPCDGVRLTMRWVDLVRNGARFQIVPRDVTENPLDSPRFVSYRLMTDLDCDVEQFAEFVP